jgi:hypothetical protein
MANHVGWRHCGVSAFAKVSCWAPRQRHKVGLRIWVTAAYYWVNVLATVADQIVVSVANFAKCLLIKLSLDSCYFRIS